MQRRGESLLREIVQRLAEEYQPEKIFLFGSYAYGQPDEDSDLDLLVIKDTQEEPGERRSRVSKIMAPARDHISVDIFVLTPSELDMELRGGNQFYQEVVFRGTLLYGEEGTYPMVEDSSPYAQGWLCVALDDFQAAELILEHGVSPNIAGMHLQQAVEKYLKAYLLFRDWRLKRAHNLVELLDDAIPYDPSFEQYRPICETVTKYYVDDRYPNAWGRKKALTLQEVESSPDQIRALIAKLLETSPG